MYVKIWSSKITLSARFVQLFSLWVALVVSTTAFGQYKPLNQSEALSEMQRFSSGKRVLYLAAHPDDENTRLIAWLSNALDAETTYLSLTRGSGGQNLLGDELGPDLGVIREHELRAARSVDGGNQRFTDALDFGYSKSVDEVWTKWDQEDLTLQVVRTIRELQPDFIITRFPPDERAGHGHHTASAELAIACAELADDPTYDLKTSAWTVEGVWWNTSIWWDQTLKDDPEAVHLDMSGFDPLLGDTYGAIGDAARSMHKCQGFGVPINRGPRDEYFKKLWGEGDLESYLDVEATGSDEASILAGEASFAVEIGDRNQSIEKWAAVGSMILDERGGNSDKYQRWQHVMLHLLGVYAEVYSSENPLEEGGSHAGMLKIQPMAQDTGLHVASVKAGNRTMGFNPPQPLLMEGYEQELELRVGQEMAVGTVRVRLEHGKSTIMLYLNPVAKMSDRAIGEFREKLAVEPKVHAKFDQSVYWNTGKASQLGYSLYASENGQHQWVVQASTLDGAKVIWQSRSSADLMPGWNHFTAEVPTKLASGRFNLQIAPYKPMNDDAFVLKPYKERHTISYPHIGTHYRYPEAQATLSVLDLNKKRIKVGYIEGAGDQMDDALESVGYTIVPITEDTPELWDEVDAILVGIRAFNTEKWLMNSSDRIQSFVSNGGNFVVTYTTAGRGGMNLPTPLPLGLGRDRVTEEDAPMSWKSHPLTTEPNELAPADFEHWVQERGLYFPKEYEGYETVFSIQESTGTSYQNSTVVGHYGKGSVIYTGLSLFRELPAGVPGAMRLLQNILHYDR